MEYVDRNIWLAAIGAGVAVGCGTFVAMDNNPIGLVFGIILAGGIIISNYIKNRNAAAS